MSITPEIDANPMTYPVAGVLSAEVVRGCKLLVGRPLRDVRVDHFSYPTRTRIVDDAYRLPVPVPVSTRPAPKISTPDYIGTGDCHNPTSNGNRTGKLLVRVRSRRPDPRV